MYFNRMLMEKEAPAQYGYERIKYNFCESSAMVKTFTEAGIQFKLDMLLNYTDHMGNKELRTLIASEYGLEANNVIIGAGSCMVLFIIYATLLGPGKHAVIMHPNYMANIEIGRSLGCDLDLYSLSFENNFQIDITRLRELIKPQTKLVSITYPHNPTGAAIDQVTLMEIVELCRENGSYLLLDEAYRDLTYGSALPHGATLGQHVISTETLSKGLGIPGIRIGWAVSSDTNLVKKFLAAKEQICICGSMIDEDFALQVLKNKPDLIPATRQDVINRFNIVKNFMAKQSYIEWIEPKGGAVCLPHIKNDIALDTDTFYEILNNKYGVFVGPGRWFEVDDRFFRLGFGAISEKKLNEGLNLIVKAVEEAANK